ncbi:MAG: 7-cyano-7-deazaguanine synthase, partial [Saccharolobus sp.]
GNDVVLLHFNYRHKAEEREREAVRKIAEYLQVPLIEIDTDLFKMIGHSTLIKGGGDIVKDRSGEEGAEFAHEWVPARNLIFLSVAIAIAESNGFDAVASGINLEEAGAYPDNEMEFIRLLNKLSPYATGPNKKVEVLMPVGNLVKHEIVKLGYEIGAPLHLTWSCYEGGQKHCGKCGPCYMRKMAYKINGLKDPIAYEE